MDFQLGSVGIHAQIREHGAKLGLAVRAHDSWFLAAYSQTRILKRLY